MYVHTNSTYTRSYHSTVQLTQKIIKGYVYVENRNGIYGLTQVGILANKLLKKNHRKNGHCKVEHTTGLWKHVIYKRQFTLVVNDFGVNIVATKT